jgi:hypothetical protein
MHQVLKNENLEYKHIKHHVCTKTPSSSRNKHIGPGNETIIQLVGSENEDVTNTRNEYESSGREKETRNVTTQIISSKMSL